MKAENIERKKERQKERKKERKKVSESPLAMVTKLVLFFSSYNYCFTALFFL